VLLSSTENLDPETSKNLKAVKKLKDKAISRARDKAYQSPAFSIVRGSDVWLRAFLLKRDEPKEIADALMMVRTGRMEISRRAEAATRKKKLTRVRRDQSFLNFKAFRAQTRPVTSIG
jgi:hypothetical protein